MLVSSVGSSGALVMGNTLMQVVPAGQVVSLHPATPQAWAIPSSGEHNHRTTGEATARESLQAPKVDQEAQFRVASETDTSKQPVEFELFRYLSETQVNTDPSSRPLLDGLENALGNFQKAAGKLMGDPAKPDVMGAWSGHVEVGGVSGSAQPSGFAKQMLELEKLMQHSKEILAAAFSVSITTGSVSAANTALNSLVKQQ